MWIIARYNKNEVETFKKELKKNVSFEVEYYQPKVKLGVKLNSQVKMKYILGDYIFCKSEKFLNSKFSLFINNVKGLKYFLKESIYNQIQIKNFISFCKSNEDPKGFLTNGFFDISTTKEYKFASGPFKDFIFKLIEKNNKYFETVLQGKKIKIDNNKINFFPV